MTLASLILLALQSSIFLLVLSIGLNADFGSAFQLFVRPAALLRALVSMGVVVPAFAVAVVVAFELPHAVEVAIVAIALSPVPPFLPLKAMKAGGRQAYTIGLLVAASAISIVWVPLFLQLISPLFPTRLGIQPASIAKLVAFSVLLPLATGMLVRHFLPALAGRTARPLMLTAALLIAVALIPVLVAEWRAILSLIGNGTVLALAALVAVGLTAGHLSAGSDSGERTVLALASGTRHPGVAVALAHANFPDDKLVLPAVLLYLVVCTLVSIPYVQWTRRGRPSEA
jgi:BASS family bile acid:Na+ symporter